MAITPPDLQAYNEPYPTNIYRENKPAESLRIFPPGLLPIHTPENPPIEELYPQHQLIGIKEAQLDDQQRQDQKG